MLTCYDTSYIVKLHLLHVVTGGDFMYPNLEAEMARKGIKRKDLAPLFKGRPATVSDKLNGKSPLLLDEARKIQSAFFPQHSLDYLFGKDESTA